MTAAAGDYWDAQKMLDIYLHDYLVKKNLNATASIFSIEANLSPHHSVVIDSPQGFLHEWFTTFHDVYASMQLKQHEHNTKQLCVQANQNIHPVVPRSARSRNLQVPRQFPVCPAPKAAKMSEEEQNRRHPIINYYSNVQPVDDSRLNLSRPTAAVPRYRWQKTHNPSQQQVSRNNVNGITKGKYAPRGTILKGKTKGLSPTYRSHATGVSQINPEALSRWVSNSLNHVTKSPPQFPILTEKFQPDQLAHAQSFKPGSMTSAFAGISIRQMLPKENLHERDAENSRKRKRLPSSRTEDLTYLTSGIGSTSKLQACMDAEDDMDDNVESFLSNDDGVYDNEVTSLSSLERRSTACSKSNRKGFTFEEISCLHPSKSKLLCCSFSSDGKILASAGHEKKVLLWNIEKFDYTKSFEGHALLVTDVRFRPNSTIFATSSFDKTVKIWDADRPTKSLFRLVGHNEQVTSVDFHPRNGDLLCSCDNSDEIRLWNVNQGSCERISKGATKQVRFLPQSGQLLAAAMGNSINVFDVEIGSILSNLKGHAKDVLSVCWDTSGKYIASVSEDSARIWSLSGGSCIYELLSNGNKFQSCTFHPSYSQLLIIGGYQVLEFWNPSGGNKTWPVPAHNGLISALADSSETEMIATTSHDQCVKLWE